MRFAKVPSLEFFKRASTLCWHVFILQLTWHLREGKRGYIYIYIYIYNYTYIYIYMVTPPMIHILPLASKKHWKNTCKMLVANVDLVHLHVLPLPAEDNVLLLLGDVLRASDLQVVVDALHWLVVHIQEQVRRIARDPRHRAEEDRHLLLKWS